MRRLPSKTIGLVLTGSSDDLERSVTMHAPDARQDELEPSTERLVLPQGHADPVGSQISTKWCAMQDKFRTPISLKLLYNLNLLCKPILRGHVDDRIPRSASQRITIAGFALNGPAAMCNHLLLFHPDFRQFSR